MKKLLLTSLLVTSSILANTIEKKDDGKGGYNYIGFGVETLNYKEKFSSGYSNATNSSPVYLSGSLTKMDELLDFSIDAASTLTSSETTEKWTQNGSVVQINQFSSMTSDLKVLLHYKLNTQNRITFGPKFSSFIVKRNTYKDSSGNYVVSTDPITGNSSRISANEENVSSLYFNIGYWYETGIMSKSDLRAKFALNYGQPIWRSASNTGFELVEFDSTTGYTYDASLYVGYQIVKGLEIGGFAEYAYSIKEGADKTAAKDDPTKNITWPENELRTKRIGLMFAWNF